MNIVNVLIAGGVILGIALVLGVGLAIANKYFEIEADDRVEQIEAVLPGYNCGACGYVSCEEMARAILDGEVKEAKACKVISDASADALREYCKQIKNNKGETIDLK
jgi:electron transport complex protein RnfB